MPIVELDDVSMWYEARGEGDPLVFLHPGAAGVDSRALTPQVESLSARYRVYTPEQRAHGRTRDVEGPASFASMATDTAGFIETVIDAPVHLLGCSDGASLALTVALRRADLVRQLVLATGVASSTPSRCTAACRTRSSPSCRARHTACWSRSPACATC